MEKTNGYYVYNPYRKKTKKDNKKEKSTYLDALEKTGKIPNETERYEAELRLQEDIQKTLNGDVKDLPEVSLLKKIDLSIDDLMLKFMGGAAGSIEGIIDFLIDVGGEVGSWFGASDEWAKKAREYDIKTNVVQNVLEAPIGPIGPITARPIWELFTPENEAQQDRELREQYSVFSQDGVGGTVGNVVEAIGGILPSIMIGDVGGAIASGLGASAKVISITSQVASTASFGMGAMGQATQQALNEGASYEDAKVYGLASGLVETGIELISGGIGGVGKGVAQGLVPKLTQNSIVKFFSNAVGEGAEEMISEVIDPYLKRVTYNENAPTSSMEQIIEAGIVGSLVGSIMQGGQTAITPRGVRVANNIQELVEVQIEYYNKGEFAKADAIAKKIKQLEQTFVNELQASNIDITGIKLETNSSALEKIDSKMAKEKLQDGEISKYKYSRDRIQQEYDDILEQMDSKKRSQYIIEKGISYKYDLETGKVSEKWSSYSKEQQQNLKEASDFVNKINKRMNNKFKVIFNHNLQTSDVNAVLFNGDTIFVNANADMNNIKQSVVKHEITHALEKTTIYTNIKDIALSIARKNKQYEKKMAQLRAEYTENPNLKDKFSKMSSEEQHTYLEEELVAEFVRENLFTSEESIANLTKQHVSMAKRILNFIKHQIELLKENPDARETSKLLKKAEQLYSKALAEYDKVRSLNYDTKYSLKNNKSNSASEDEKNKIDEMSKRIGKETSNPSDAVKTKAYADLNAKTTFTKKEIDEAIRFIMDDITNYGGHNVKKGADVLSKMLFLKLNTIKADTKPAVRSKIFNNLASTMLDYVEAVNNISFSASEKTTAFNYILSDIQMYYENFGKEAKFISFKKHVFNKISNLKNEIQEIKVRAKLASKIAKLANTFEKYKENSTQPTVRSKLINSQLKAMSGMLNKISSGDHIKGTVRKQIVNYRDQFYNTDSAVIYKKQVGDKFEIITKAEFEKIQANNEKIIESNKKLPTEQQKAITVIVTDNLYEINNETLEDINMIAKNVTRVTRNGNTIENTAPLSEQEAKAVLRILADAKHIIEHYNLITVAGKTIETDAIASEANNIVSKSEAFKVSKAENYIRSLLNPRVIFEMLDHFDPNGVLTKLFDDIQTGERSFYKNYLESTREMYAFHKKYKNYRKGLGKKVIINGVTMKWGEALSIYQLSKRKDAERHLFSAQYGGVVLKDDKGRLIRYKPTQTDILAIESKLTETDKEYLKTVHRFFNLFAHNLKFNADVSIKGYSHIDENTYDTYQASDYFPMSSDFTATYHSLGNARTPDTRTESVFYYSFNQDLVAHANNALAISNIDEVVFNHARQVSLYASMYLPIQNMSIIWNKPIIQDKRVTTLRQEVSSIWSDAFDYIDTLLKDIQGSYNRTKNWLEKVLISMRRMYTRFQLALNGQTIVKQSLSLFNSMYRLDATSVARGVTMKVDMSEMYKYCPYVEYRALDSRIITTEGLFEQVDSNLDILNVPLEKYDMLLLAKLYNACKVQVSAEHHLNIDSEECKERAGLLLEEITRHTQPTSTSDKPALLRSNNELVKQLVMFRNSPLQNISIMAESIYEYNALKQIKKEQGDSKQINDRIKQAEKHIKKSFNANILSMLVSAIITTGFAKLRGKDDEEETFGQEILSNFVDEIFGMFPVIAEIQGYLSDGFELSIPSVDTFNRVMQSTKALVEKANGDEFSKADFRNILFAFGQLFGIPTRNLVNVARSTTNITDAIFGSNTNDEVIGLLYDKDLSQQKKDINTYLARNRVDKAGQVVEDILRSRGLTNVPEALTKKYATFAGNNLYSYPKALSSKISINGAEYLLTDSEYSQIQKRYNTANTVAIKAMNYKEFANLSVANQNKVLNKIYESYYYSAISDNIDIDIDMSKLKTAIYDDIIPIYKLLTHYYIIEQLTADKPNKKQIATKYINSLQMSRLQKEMFMIYLGYSTKPTIIPTIRNYLTSRGIVGEERNYILALCE